MIRRRAVAATFNRDFARVVAALPRMNLIKTLIADVRRLDGAAARLGNSGVATILTRSACERIGAAIQRAAIHIYAKETMIVDDGAAEFVLGRLSLA